LATRDKLLLIHPYDDPLVIAGQGTAALEMLALVPDLDDLLVPCGGGGLLAGVAVACKALSPRTRVIGVQVERYSALHDWFHRKTSAPDATQSADTLAEGIAVKDPSALTRQHIRRHVDEMLKVSEEDIENAINELLEHEKTVVEGAGAAALAALLNRRRRFRGRKVGCILSGGNIDSRVLAETVLRGLARSGRLCSLRLVIRDLPGALAKITALVASAGGNIVDIRHQRVFSEPKARTELEMDLAVRDRRHARRITVALRGAGYSVRLQG
jgi:threonine dehydratase